MGRLQCCSTAKGRHKGTLPFYNPPFISLGLFPSILLFGLPLSNNWQQFKTPVVFLGVYRRVYPRRTSKKVILICRFVTFSLLKLGCNTKVVHSKQLGRTANMTFVNFFASPREEMDNTEEELEVRLIIKTDNNYL